MKKNIKEVLTDLRIYVTPDDMFPAKLQYIFNPFTKINTNSYSKLLSMLEVTNQPLSLSGSSSVTLLFGALLLDVE